MEGRADPMEAHFVHQDSHGGLAVVSVLIEEGAANAALAEAWAYLPAGESAEKEVAEVSVDAGAILPPGGPDPLSTELMAGSAAANLLEEISHRYADRIVILDTPPVLPTSEPSALALPVGLIVVVADAGSTLKHPSKHPPAPIFALSPSNSTSGGELSNS